MTSGGIGVMAQRRCGSYFPDTFLVRVLAIGGSIPSPTHTTPAPATHRRSIFRESEEVAELCPRKRPRLPKQKPGCKTLVSFDNSDTMDRCRSRITPVGKPPSRRDWLRIGLPALLGTSATRAESTAPGFGKAKSVLVVFTSGGQSQLDTWDPKPDMPLEVRGAFGTIATSVPGLRVCDHLPQVAKQLHRAALVRSMTHDDLDHGSACYLALTGQFHQRKTSNPSPRGTDAPALGSLLHRVRPDRRFPHSAFHVNGPLLTPREPGPGQYGGVLAAGTIRSNSAT